MAIKDTEDIRLLRKQKANRPVFKQGFPSNREGENGDITFRLTENGLGMYGKVNNEWFKFADGLRIGRYGQSRKYSESGGWGKDVVGDKISVGRKLVSLKTATDLKTGLSLENVTNESKTTMFTQPVFTGDAGSGSNPIVNTSESNSIKLAFDDADENFEVRLIGNTNENFISFYQAGVAKWAMGFNGASSTTFRIDAGNDLATDVLQLTSAGALTVDSTVTSSNGVCSGTGALDAGSSTIDTTGAVSTGALTCTTINTGQGANEVYDMDQNVKTGSAVTFATVDTGQGANELYDMDQNVKTDSSVGFAEITSGAVVWAEFPFNVQNAIHNRYYFRDVDDLDDFRKWDSNDTDPTGFNYRNVAGSYTVPEDCTLLAMSGVVANAGATQNPTVFVFTGAVTEGTGDTTLSSAGSVAVSIGTSYVPTKFSDTYDVDLSAGDIVVPMIRSVNLGATPDFYGSLTLKFITR